MPTELWVSVQTFHPSRCIALTFCQTIVRDLWTLWLSKLGHRLQDLAQSQQTGRESEGETSGTSENEDDTNFETDYEANPSRKRNSARNGPTLVDTIALNYLGITLLRRQVSLATILRLAKTQLLYKGLLIIIIQ